MKYKFINSQKILIISPRLQKIQSVNAYVYANKQNIEFKELVIEEKPTYNEKTQELYSWFENGEVITQKFKVIDKEVI